MASRSHKLYHETSNFDTRRHLDTYLANKPDITFKDDFMTIPMEKLYNVLKSGLIKGRSLTDISFGSVVHHLYVLCDFFEEILVLKFSDRCVMEVNKWRHDRTGAYDWSHAAPIIQQLQGESDHPEEKDIKVKKVITQVVKCDPNKANLIDPLSVPPADCLLSAALLECISKNKEDYIKNMKKFMKFIKPGGHLILFGFLNASYYMVGEEKFHVLPCDENFIKEALIGEGFTIDQCEVLKRKCGESPLVDFNGIAFVIAHKEQ